MTFDPNDPPRPSTLTERVRDAEFDRDRVLDTAASLLRALAYEDSLPDPPRRTVDVITARHRLGEQIGTQAVSGVGVPEAHIQQGSQESREDALRRGRNWVAGRKSYLHWSTMYVLSRIAVELSDA